MSRDDAADQDAFVAALAHRLRGPLHTMFAAVPQLRASNDAVRNRAAHIIERHLQREAQVVDELENILQALKIRSVKDTTMATTRLPRLLIVDDSADALEMWAFYFRSSAFDVDTAASGAAALAAADRR